MAGGMGILSGGPKPSAPFRPYSAELRPELGGWVDECIPYYVLLIWPTTCHPAPLILMGLRPPEGEAGVYAGMSLPSSAIPPNRFSPDASGSCSAGPTRRCALSHAP